MEASDHRASLLAISAVACPAVLASVVGGLQEIDRSLSGSEVALAVVLDPNKPDGGHPIRRLEIRPAQVASMRMR